jgi:ubiquinone/menaquinone biosynthesis C-methylase UbiE
MRTITRHWKDIYSKLSEVDVEHPYGNAMIRLTMRPWEYAGRAKEIAGRLKDGDTILEIGCGYGGLAQEILKRVSVSYTVVDNEVMLAQTRKLLGDRAEYVTADRIETLYGREFDLFIAHACLSEFPFEYREYVLKDIMKNCRKVSVIDYNDLHKPNQSQLDMGWEMLPAITEYYLNKYFVIKKRRRRKCSAPNFIFNGERRK